MSAMACQITSPTIVYSSVYSGADQGKHRVTGLCEGKSPVNGEFHAQRASDAEIISIWWRHHAKEYSVQMERIMEQFWQEASLQK